MREDLLELTLNGEFLLMPVERRIGEIVAQLAQLLEEALHKSRIGKLHEHRNASR
ncbi:MAG: hypothetical protein ABSG51_18075 [Terracidiphilus sp.]